MNELEAAKVMLGGLLATAELVRHHPHLGRDLSGVKEVAPYVILVIILMIKPYGLFGTKEIERV